MEEKLVWIKGFEGKYKVSNFGYILRISHTYENLAYKKGFGILSEKKLGGTKLNSRGYARVNLNGTWKFIHTLVAETFLINSDNLQQVNHKDGNKLNNHLSNLEWVSNQQNRDHAVKNKLIAYGEKVPQSKLTVLQIREIKELYSTGNYTQKELSSKYNVTQQTFSKIVRNESWVIASKD